MGAGRADSPKQEAFGWRPRERLSLKQEKERALWVRGLCVVPETKAGSPWGQEVSRLGGRPKTLRTAAQKDGGNLRLGDVGGS